MPNRARLLVLVGLKHTGKSTVARALSRAAGFRLYELDNMITHENPYPTIAAAYTALGRRRFRAYEHAALRQALRAAATGSGDCIVDCGGGVGEYRPSRRTLRRWLRQDKAARARVGAAQREVVYLQADSRTLSDRFAPAGAPPPAFLNSRRGGGDAPHDSKGETVAPARWQARWRAIAQHRARIYARLATITIDSRPLTPLIEQPGALCAAILPQLERQRRRTGCNHGRKKHAG